MSTRCGFLALAGRPNVGKSTLLNGLVGRPVAAVSPRPQTTRRALRGVRTRGKNQLVVVDLPGLQRPRDLLTARMASCLSEGLAEADLVLLVVDGAAGIGPGDRRLAQTVKELRSVTTVAVNKVDLLSRRRTAEALLAAEAFGLAGEIFPLSARTGAGVEALASHLEALLPEGPHLFGPNLCSDQPLFIQVAEPIREALLTRLYAEVPHATEVVVEEVVRRRGGWFVAAVVVVETASQKRIVVGEGGKVIKAVGTAARSGLERLLGGSIYLNLTVRARKGWRSSAPALSELAIE